MNQDRRDAINEAFYDAICDGEGRGDADHLVHHLAKRGLVIVERAAIDGLILSLEGDGRETDYPSSLRTVRAALSPAPEG